MKEIIPHKINKIFYIIFIFFLSISAILLVLEIYNQKKESNIVKEYYKEQFASKEFLMFKGQWIITEYIDEAVEYHGIDTDTEKYKSLLKKHIEDITQKYLGETINIYENNVTSFGPLNELGFYCKDWDDLFMVVR